jgi:hypothetical protein
MYDSFLEDYTWIVYLFPYWVMELLIKKEFSFLYRIMAPITIDHDCMWNYSFCELMDFGVKIDDD